MSSDGNSAPPPIPTQKWTAGEVRPGKTQENPKVPNETLQKFWVDFKGEDGFPASGTYWRRKEGNPPQEGETYTGTVSVGDYGYMFKLGDGGGFTGSSGGSANFKSKRPEPPEKTAVINRSVALKVAASYLAGQGKPYTLADLFAAATEIEIDLIQVGDKAAQGSGAVAEPAAPPPAQTPTYSQEELHGILEKAGAFPAAATVMARYLVSERDETMHRSMVERLENPNMVVATLDRLTELVEAWSGEPLPTTTPADDDIPF